MQDTAKTLRVHQADQKRSISRAYGGMAASGDYEAHYATALGEAENSHVRSLARRHGFAAGRDTVLDLGCGDGAWVSIVGQGPIHYNGFDISEGMVERASKVHPQHAFSVGDAEDRTTWPATDAQLLVSLWALCHTQLPTVARQIASHLEPGGRVLIIDCAPRHRWKANYPFLEGEMDGSVPSRILWPVPMYRRIFEAQGFRAVHARAFGPWATLPKWVPGWGAKALFHLGNLACRLVPSLAYYQGFVFERVHD